MNWVPDNSVDFVISPANLSTGKKIKLELDLLTGEKIVGEFLDSYYHTEPIFKPFILLWLS